MNPLRMALLGRPANELVLEGADGVYTAGQLFGCIAELEVALMRTGIGRLGLWAGNSAAWVITDLACQVANICLLPLPTFFSATQLQHSIQAVGVDAVLTDDPERLRQLLPAELIADVGVKSDKSSANNEWCGLTLVKLQQNGHPELPVDTQKITFTSGSTGTPRGVCLGVEQQLRVARALDNALKITAPRHLCLLPLSTLLENIGGVYYPLLAGGSIVSPNEKDRGFSGSAGLDLARLLQSIVLHRPTSIILLPQMLVGLVAALEGGWQPPAELRFAAVGGAKVSAELIRRARQSGLPVYEGYGLSETASVACLNFPGNDSIGTVGRPLAHVEVGIEAGEVIIRDNSFLGYLNDPSSWGIRSVATGDLGELDAAGYLHLQGRRKNLLISSFGRNISPEWVESEVLRNPEICQCIVFGDSRPHCVALIVPADPTISNDKLQQLLNRVNTELPDYAQVKSWHRLTKPLTHSDGMLTENGRPRRAVIATAFVPIIESLYSSPVRSAER